MERADVRMIQAGDGASFLLETRRVLALQLFDRDYAVKTRVTCLPNLAHSAGTDGRKDFIRSQSSPRGERHMIGSAKFSRSKEWIVPASRRTRKLSSAFP